MSRPVAGAGARLAAATALLSGACGVVALAGARADSFTPVQLGITIAQTAHSGTALPISVAITADPDALDASSALYMRVKLAPECGGTWAGTPGPVLLDKALSPQPSPGQRYTATLSGSGTPSTQGVETVCAFLEDQADSRVYATSQAFTVTVGKPLPRRRGRHVRHPRAPHHKRKVHR